MPRYRPLIPESVRIPDNDERMQVRVSLCGFERNRDAKKVALFPSP